MKRGGLGGAVLLVAAALLVALLALDREPAPGRAPRIPQAQPPPAVDPGPALPPEPPPTAGDGAPPAPKPGARLVGRVTDEGGHPIAGAELLLAERHSAAREVIATADADGKYLADGVQGGDLMVGAIAKGYAPSTLRPIGDAWRPVYEIDFALRRGGGALSLVIRTEDGGAPESSILVDPFFEEEPEPPEMCGGRRVVRARGDATIDGLVPEWSRVLVTARGYAPVFLPVRLHAGGPVEASVVLETGATLVGTVRTGDGTPVADAQVRSSAWSWRCLTTTDATGAYRIEHLPKGRLAMEAEGAGGRAWAFLELENGKEAVWDPVLRAPECLFGRVVDEGGSPVPRALVVCRQEGSGASPTAETGEDGGFRLWVREATHRVGAWWPGARGAVPAVEVSVRPSNSPVTLTLPRGQGYVRGGAVDRTGAPAAGAMVRTWPASRPGQELRARALADGTFRIGPLPPGSYLAELHIDGEPTLHVRPAFPVVAGETRDLGTIRFAAGGRIRASVLHVSGAAVPGASIQVFSLDRTIAFAGEEDAGTFLSEELAPGRYLVRAAGMVEEASVESGGVTAVELRVRPGGRLKVVTVGLDGQSIDAVFRVEDGRGHVVRDDDHRTTVHLPAGDYRVLGRDETGLNGQANVRIGPDAGEVDLILVLR